MTIYIYIYIYIYIHQDLRGLLAHHAGENNGIGTRTQLCFTLLVIRRGTVGLCAAGLSCSRNLEDSVVVPQSATFILCSLCRMLSSGQRTLHAAPCFTPGTSLPMSAVLILNWFSERYSSVMAGTSLFSRILARILPAMESRVIPRKFEPSDLSPLFLYRVLMTPSQRS